jgi:hypothetical protein
MLMQTFDSTVDEIVGKFLRHVLLKNKLFCCEFLHSKPVMLLVISDMAATNCVTATLTQ